MSKSFPKKYNHLDTQAKWTKFWSEKGCYHFDKNSTKSHYVIDTPPPTVSGSLHVGHVFSYTQTDVLARQKRMSGLNVFYPIGWDDNGLPTERRVQKQFAIKCNPHIAYKQNWKPQTATKKSKVIEVSRNNFLEACHIQTLEDEKKYQALWQNLGLSIDWNQQYETINEHCRKISQFSFLDLIEKGYAYSKESPTMWDTEFQTAIAQAEVEDREVNGLYHDIRFATETGEDFVISTTRPELLPACIAIVAHPEDERYKHLFGKKAISPLFHADIPILPAEHADPEKGTGILMVCTFGDAHDVDFWKKSDLPLKAVISRQGQMLDLTFGEGVFNSLKPEIANETYSLIKGLYVKQSRKKIVEMLSEDNSCVANKGKALVGELRPTLQAVRFYEKGEHPLQYISTRQWFIKVCDYKNELLEQGRKINWHPEHMYKKYENWVNGLQVDWCISRQRFFGVPFPVWYKLDKEGSPDYQNPIFADKTKLPLDPQIECPPGFNEDQRNQPNGFIADPDVMDTWATSSVTPQISSHWGIDSNRHEKLFPADLRPQAHEIIRTWAFYTITKAWMHEKKIPWKNIAISGWVVNPNREKMSKSKGKTVTPEMVIEKYSSDAVRYWASKAKLGTDTIYSEDMFKIGQRLTTKIFNVSKFVHMQLQNEDGSFNKVNRSQITNEIDKSWVKRIDHLVREATIEFERYNYATALSQTEDLFWDFCDFYIELVKSRAYQDKDKKDGKSALAALSYSLEVLLKLFAPILPYITEEVWSWHFNEKEEKSIHNSSWPKPFEYEHYDERDKNLLALAIKTVSDLRSAKTTAQKSLKWPVENFTIVGSEESINFLKLIENDVIRVGNLKHSPTYDVKELEDGNIVATEVTLSVTNDV